jgi:hypothetical protein
VTGEIIIGVDLLGHRKRPTLRTESFERFLIVNPA